MNACTEADLQRQLAEYQDEKSRVRKVMDQVCGRKTRWQDRAINVGFVVLIVLLFGHSLVREFFGISLHVLSPVLSLEIAVLLVSLKIIWMIHLQNHIEHFQFWILNSLEFQVSLISKKIEEIEAKMQS